MSLGFVEMDYKGEPMKKASFILIFAAFLTFSAHAQRQAAVFSNAAGCQFMVSSPSLSEGEEAQVKIVLPKGDEKTFEGVLEKIKFIGPRLDSFSLKYNRFMSRKANYIFLHTLLRPASATQDNDKNVDLPKGAYLEDGYFPGYRVVDDKGNFHEVSNTRAIYCEGAT